MKNRIFLFLCFVTFWSIPSYGFMDDFMDAVFHIEENSNNPTTTNGKVSHFRAYPTYYSINWYVDTTRCFVTNSNGNLGGTLQGYDLYVVFKNIKINKTSDTISATGNGKWAVYNVNGFTL